MNRVDHSHLPVVAQTHPGMTGKNNEDRYGVSAFQLANGQPALLALLSDGIGGHRAGEVAAEMAVERISSLTALSDGKKPVETLRQAVETASDEIFAQSQSRDRQGMGATVACAWMIGLNLYAATVGDSRIYLMRKNVIQQLSTDHTWIQEAIDRGVLQPGQGQGHPNAHVIRRYLGSPKPPSVDFRLRMSGDETDKEALANQGLELQGGDRLLLCTDGLTDLVTPLEIMNAFSSLSMPAAVSALIDLANQRGGHDNITLIAIEVPVSYARRVKRRREGLAALGIFGLAVLVGLAITVALLVSQSGLLGGQTTPTVNLTPLAPPISTAAPATLPTTSNAITTASAPWSTPDVGGGGGVTMTPWPTNTFPPP